MYLGLKTNFFKVKSYLTVLVRDPASRIYILKRLNSKHDAMMNYRDIAFMICELKLHKNFVEFKTRKQYNGTDVPLHNHLIIRLRFFSALFELANSVILHVYPN